MKTIVIVSLISLFLLASCTTSSYSQESMNDFASCLAENEATMYGAFWCPHCVDQKKEFGTSIKLVNYVECDPRGDNEQSELCIEKDIKGYPTWEFKDGSRLEGKIPFATLSEKTGCPIPSE